MIRSVCLVAIGFLAVAGTSAALVLEKSEDKACAKQSRVSAQTQFITQPPPGERPGQPPRPGQSGRPGAGGFGRPGQLMSPFMMEQLKLTDEQKKAIADLQKEVDEKVQKLLTDEQKKTMKEMAERRPGFGRPGGPGGPGGRPGTPGGPGGPGGRPTRPGGEGDRPSRPPLN